MGFDKTDSSLTVTIFSAASSGICTRTPLEGHHKLDGVEAVGAQIVNEAGVFGHLDSSTPNARRRSS